MFTVKMGENFSIADFITSFGFVAIVIYSSERKN